MLVACSTLATDPATIVSGELPLSWSDVRDVERQLPALGIRLPIYAISIEAVDRAEISCALPMSAEERERFARREIVTLPAVVFTVRRRNGHWFADRSSVRKTTHTLRAM